MTITLNTELLTAIVCFIWVLLLAWIGRKNKPFYGVFWEALVASVVIYFPLICIWFLNFIGVDW